MVQENGSNAFTMRDLSGRIGVSRTAAYRHFPDKAALLAAISETGFMEFEAALRQAKDHAEGGSSAKLDAMGLAYVRFAHQRRPYYEVMFGARRDQGDHNRSGAGERAYRALLDTIVEGQQSGEFRRGDPALLANIVWSMMHGIAMLRLETDLSDGGAGARFVKAAEEVLKRGILADRLGSL